MPEAEAGVLKGEVESWKILALLANEKRDAIAARVASMQTERDDALEQVAELERAALKAEQQAAAEPVAWGGVMDNVSAIAARHAEDEAEGPFVGRRSEQARLDRGKLLEEIARLRESLAIFVHAHSTGNSVPPHIEKKARALVKEVGGE